MTIDKALEKAAVEFLQRTSYQVMAITVERGAFRSCARFAGLNPDIDSFTMQTVAGPVDIIDGGRT